MKHTFRITSPVLDDSEVVLVVDDEIMTEAQAHEINNFWSSSVFRLADENGDIIQVVAKMFGEQVLRYAVGDEGALANSADGCERYLKYVLDDVGEGWPDKDDLGITILKIDVPNVTDYVEIEKL